MCPLFLAVDNSSPVALEVHNICVYKTDEEAWSFHILFLLIKYCFIFLLYFLSLLCH